MPEEKEDWAVSEANVFDKNQKKVMILYTAVSFTAEVSEKITNVCEN